jgi:hypothetical protein
LVEQVKHLDPALVEIVPIWSMAPVVDAFQAMRGVGFVASVIFVAEAISSGLIISPKMKKTHRAVAESRPSPGLQCSCRGCWRDDWSFPVISEKCRQLPQRGAPFLVHGYKAAV